MFSHFLNLPGPKSKSGAVAFETKGRIIVEHQWQPLFAILLATCVCKSRKYVCPLAQVVLGFLRDSLSFEQALWMLGQPDALHRRGRNYLHKHAWHGKGTMGRTEILGSLPEDPGGCTSADHWRWVVLAMASALHDGVESSIAWSSVLGQSGTKRAFASNTENDEMTTIQLIAVRQVYNLGVFLELSTPAQLFQREGQWQHQALPLQNSHELRCGLSSEAAQVMMTPPPCLHTSVIPVKSKY